MNSYAGIFHGFDLELNNYEKYTTLEQKMSESEHGNIR